MASNLPEVKVVIPPLGKNKKENLFHMIIFALHYFGCDNGDIFRVLLSYGHPNKPDIVSDYIIKQKLIDHYVRGHHCPDDRKIIRNVNTNGVNVQVTIQYNSTFPETIRVKCSELPSSAHSTDTVITRDPEMANIGTKTTRNCLLCYMTNANLHMLDDC